jgi:hypothetical protein
LLDPPPAVLGIGEAHAQQGTESVEPTTQRFMRELLPLLAGRASDIVIELMLPNRRCAAETKQAASEQKVVTQHQAKSDQSDYVELGARAKALGVRPHALEPTCDDLSRIAGAGPDAVTVSLDVVTRLMTETLSKLAAVNAVARDPRMVVAYGGLMHNDLEPRSETARWSFGPALGERTNARYTELDLVVREQIRAAPTWQVLPWVRGFESVHTEDAVLLSPGERSFVLVFSHGPEQPPRSGEPTPVAPSASPR